MTPDEYRRKYKSCYTCEYFEKANPFTCKEKSCIVKNRELKGDEGKKCKAYSYVPLFLEQIRQFKQERETNE